MIPQIAFILSCLLLQQSYYKMDLYLYDRVKSYSSLDEAKQVYVIKNVLKGLYLCFIMLCSTYYVIPDIINGVWNNTIIQTFASLYVSNDIVGLYNVKLHASTRLHHMTCAVFLLGAWGADFQQSQTAKMLAMYTIFSAASFPVNLYLGARYLFRKENPDMVALKHCASMTYVLCCAMNWIVQCYMGWHNSELYLAPYIAGLVFIVYDDIILLRWFFK
jgi:hypothetical protein